MNRRGRIYFIVSFLLLFLILDVAAATWLLNPLRVRKYVVQPGDTLADIARKSGTHEQVIADENELRPGALIEPGQVLSIPSPPFAPLLEWELQLVGLAGTCVGVFISFWLCRTAGLLPRILHRRVFGVSLAVAIISYATMQASNPELPSTITPVFLLNAIKDGFAWSTSIPLLANALGFHPDRS